MAKMVSYAKTLEKQKKLDFATDVAKFTDRQMEAMNLILRQFIPNCAFPIVKFLLYGGCLGGGKLLRLSTPIPTISGWTTMGEVLVGDIVFDENGNPCNVVVVSEEQKDKTFLIKFSDGSEIVAGASHEWVTETDKDRHKQLRHSDSFREKRKAGRPSRGAGKRPDLAELNRSREHNYLDQPIPTVKTTQEIADTLKDGKQINHSIPVCKPLNTTSGMCVNLPIHSYVLGAWLGDGCSTSGQISGIDEEILNEIRTQGYEVTDHACVKSHGIIGLQKQLKELGVYRNKHIPDVYLRSSISQRLSLLQGLMDTDGYCDKRGQCEIQLTRKELIEGVYELICSLGIKVQMRVGRARLYGKDCGEKYRLKFLTDLPVFKLTRKLERQKRDGFRGTHSRRYIISVEELPSEPMKCIQVDSPSHLYLAGKSMIPTHNSFFLRWILVLLLMAWFQLKGLKKVQVMLACEDFPTLKDRQLSKISVQFPLWLGRSYSDHKDYGRCYILNDEYGGGIICFRNLDDASKYQSSEWAAIAVDELTKNPLDVFTDLRMRLRWPGLRDEECPFIGGTNPGGIGHNYVKAFWMDKNFPEEFIHPVDYRPMFAYVPSKAEDNPYLDAGYWQMLNTLPPHLRAAFKDGSWDTFVGQAFQEWSRTYHVVEPPKPLVPEGRPIYMTFDWGFGKPFSVGWWWIDSDGRKYRFNEWYGWNGTPDQGIRLTDSEIAEGIIKREQAMGFNVEQGSSPKVINPQITRLCDPTSFNKKPDYKGGGQGPSTAEIFMNMGLQMMPGDPSRVLKWRQFHEHLRVPRDEEGNVNGTPMLQVYSSCQHFIRTVPSLVVDPNNIEDVWSDGEDHVADEAALLLMYRPLTQLPPKEEKHKPPKNITEVAALEREQIWDEIRAAEEREKTEGMFY